LFGIAAEASAPTFQPLLFWKFCSASGVMNMMTIERCSAPSWMPREPPPML
jgi:hypothetical protein